MTKPLHRTLLALAVAYLFTVAAIVFWPSPVDRPAAGTLNELLSWLHLHGMPKFINYNFVEFSANVAMFVPMGFIASAFFKRSWAAIVAGMLASGLIEASQALFLPDRFASGLDVLANTMGAAVGALIYVLMVRRPARMLPVFLSAAPDSPLPSRAVHSTSKVAK